MSRNVLALQEPNTPMPSRPDCLALISRCSDEGGTLTIDQRFALTAQDRQGLERFVAAVSAAVEPDTGADRMLPVLAILKGYPSQTGSSTDGATAGALFRKALAGVPGWAIAMACEDFVAGRIEGASDTYAPTPTVLAKRAASHVATLRADQYRARQLLRAKVVTRVSEAEREAVKRRFTGLLADMGVGKGVAE